MSEWLTSEGDWQAFFDTYRRIVLVANSDGVDIEGVLREHRDRTLYVFFNKVYKVLDGPFPHAALLIARSSSVGANIVHRHEVGSVLSYFPQETFAGVLNLACGPEECFSEASEFEGRPAGKLRLVEHFESFYPKTHVPTSGFAFALWLAETCKVEIVLEGFTAKRSLRWKLFTDHDWTFEQTCLRLLARSGTLRMRGIAQSNAYAELSRRFPAIESGMVAVTAAEVLADRAESIGVAVDRLLSVTRFQRRFYEFLRRIKPKTRKERRREMLGVGLRKD